MLACSEARPLSDYAPDSLASRLGCSQVLYSLIATFCREYLGPSLKKWSPRFFGDGALNLELFVKRRSELWVLLKDDIGVVRKGGRRHVVTRSDVQVVNVLGGHAQPEETQPGKPHPRILQIVDEQAATGLDGYYIRMPDSTFVAYGDWLPECESRGVVWAGNKVLYVVPTPRSAKVHSLRNPAGGSGCRMANFVAPRSLVTHHCGRSKRECVSKGSVPVVIIPRLRSRI